LAPGRVVATFLAISSMTTRALPLASWPVTTRRTVRLIDTLLHALRASCCGSDEFRHSASEDARKRACGSTLPTKQGAASIAGAVVELGNLGGAAVAVVAIGAPVAAANRPVFAGTHLRSPHAGAVNVGGVAQPDAVVAEQPLAAGEANDGAADRPFAAAAPRSLLAAAPWGLLAAARMGGNGEGSHNGEGDKEDEDGAHAGLRCCHGL